MDFLASRSIDFPHIPARDSAENRSIGPVDCDTGPNLCKHSGKRNESCSIPNSFPGLINCPMFWGHLRIPRCHILLIFPLQEQQFSKGDFRCCSVEISGTAVPTFSLHKDGAEHGSVRPWSGGIRDPREAGRWKGSEPVSARRVI